MTTFRWDYDANTVTVAGAWDNWQSQTPLVADAKGFHTTIQLEQGTWQYKFVVDDRRWCYDILKPTKADDKGNRNNVVNVGKGHSAPPKGKEAASPAPQKEAASPVHHKEAASPVSQEEPAQPAQSKKERQQQQQQQKKEQKPKEKKPSGAAKGAAQKVISTVKSYGAPWFVADLEIEDNVDEILETAEIFSKALPDSACLFLSGGQKLFIIVAVVPPSKSGDLSATEMVNTALTVVANPPPAQGTDNLAHAIVNADPDKGVFPLKLKDLTRGPVFQVLRKRGLVKEDEDSDDEPLPSFDDV